MDFPMYKLPPYHIVEPLMDMAAAIVARKGKRYEQGTRCAHLESPFEYVLSGYDGDEAILLPLIGEGFAVYVPACNVFSIEDATNLTQQLIWKLN